MSGRLAVPRVRTIGIRAFLDAVSRLSGVRRLTLRQSVLNLSVCRQVSTTFGRISSVIAFKA